MVRGSTPLGPTRYSAALQQQGGFFCQEGCMVYLYVLQGTIKRYIGITNDIKRRLAEHKAKSSKGSQVIGEFSLLLVEEYPDYVTARQREKYLKSGAGRRWLRNLASGQSPPLSADAETGG